MSDTTVSLPPSPPKGIITILNTLISLLLRSPLHGVLSKSCILIAFRGIKSGKLYQFPVGFYGHQANQLYIIPLHAWWKNLRGPVPVTIWLYGRRYEANATASQGDEATVAALLPLLTTSSSLLRLYKVPKDVAGQTDARRLQQVAEALPLIRIRLN